MAHSQNTRPLSLWALSCLLFFTHKPAVAQTQGPSIPLAYCASVNTNSGFKPFYSDYQSEGRCYGNCTDADYALAVIQSKNCWCSNTVPAGSDRKPLSDCHGPCPGYPSDYCGDKGVFVYLALKNVPSDTDSGDDSSPPSTSSSPTEPLVQTVTVGGTVKTVTATPSGDSTDAPSLAETNSSGGGLGTGAAVGIAVGVVVALVVAGAFLWMWCVKRKRQEEAADVRQYGSPSGYASSGMMGTPKTAEVSENRFGGLSDGETAGGQSTVGRRRSHLMPVDPRVDYTKGIYSGPANKSKESMSSLQDNHDYSRPIQNRVLQVRNPDPEDD